MLVLKWVDVGEQNVVQMVLEHFCNDDNNNGSRLFGGIWRRSFGVAWILVLGTGTTIAFLNSVGTVPDRIILLYSRHTVVMVEKGQLLIICDDVPSCPEAFLFGTVAR